MLLQEVAKPWPMERTSSLLPSCFSACSHYRRSCRRHLLQVPEPSLVKCSALRGLQSVSVNKLIFSHILKKKKKIKMSSAAKVCFVCCIGVMWQPELRHRCRVVLKAKVALLVGTLHGDLFLTLWPLCILVFNIFPTHTVNTYSYIRHAEGEEYKCEGMCAVPAT